jgi:hypothetical protein
VLIATYDIANCKADKALETSDLSTTDVDGDRNDQSESRFRHVPVRYSPPPPPPTICKHSQHVKAGSSKKSSEVPVVPPVPVVPSGLLLNSSVSLNSTPLRPTAVSSRSEMSLSGGHAGYNRSVSGSAASPIPSGTTTVSSPGPLPAGCVIIHTVRYYLIYLRHALVTAINLNKYYVYICCGLIKFSVLPTFIQIIECRL